MSEFLATTKTAAQKSVHLSSIFIFLCRKSHESRLSFLYAWKEKEAILGSMAVARSKLPNLLIILQLSFIGGSEVPIYPCTSGEAQGSHGVRPTWIDPTLSQVGLLQTPNFPRPFALPLECLWIFDLSKAQAKTNYLHFYFTQVGGTPKVTLFDLTR